MKDNPNKNSQDVQALVEIVARLRSPTGCPWDREQTHSTLARYAIEEAFEMVEALEHREALRSSMKDSAEGGSSAKPENLDANLNQFDKPLSDETRLASLTEKFKDELGDVLFQVVLHAQLAEEDQAFNFHDVVRTLSEKLVRRHPHVFSDVSVTGTDEVIKNWEEIKKAERAKDQTAAESFISVPAKIPALQRAAAIGRKTQKLKFDWQNPSEVWIKVREEIEELQEAMDNDVQSEIEHEIGDVLFSVAQLARHYEMDPEQLLRTANTRFLGRFEKMLHAFASSGASQNPSIASSPAPSSFLPSLEISASPSSSMANSAKNASELLEQFGQLSNEEKEKFWSIAKKK